MAGFLQSLQALEQTSTLADGCYLVDGDYRIQQALQILCEAADKTRKGHLSNEMLEDYVNRLSTVQERLVERTRRVPRSKQNPPPEGKGHIKRVSDHLKQLMGRSLNVNRNGNAPGDTEMNDAARDDDAVEIIV